MVNKNTEYLNDSLGITSSDEVKQYKVPHYRVSLVRENDLATDYEIKHITQPKHIYDMVRNYIGLCDREYVLVAMLNTKNMVIGINTVSIGTLSGSMVHPREMLKPAIIAGASIIILIHNHPSGDPTPSHHDLEVARRLSDACNIMGINLRDSVIVCADSYFSFREKGLI